VTRIGKRTLRAVAFGAVVAAALPAVAQESQFASDVRREGEHIAGSCNAFAPAALAGCAVTLATEDPFHVALGSLAPQNDVAFGLAFAEHYTPNERWRLSWNADGVRTFSGSWRAGAYMKIIRTPESPGVVVRTGGAPSGAPITIREYPVFNVYLQSTSLNTLFFFGPGASSAEAGRSVFGEHQTIVGTSAVIPLTAPAVIRILRPAFVGAINGRFVQLRGNTSASSPSIEQLYDDRTAPGLSDQPAFTQFEEGLRFTPSAANGHVLFNYLVDFQQFVASAESHSSFHRWTVDLNHQFPLYRTAASAGPKDTNGPNECFESVGSTGCPPLTFSRNREGAVAFRFLISSSAAGDDNQVPFYLQRTLGGSDINGDRLLSSFQDYRFRAPNLMALQESIEHSLWGPVGIFLLAEQGKVADQRSDLDFQDLEHSVAVGFTLRAGGFPVVNLSFAWGGEGHHIIGTIDSSLLGGSRRPSLY
jgi:hypothetical protein